MIPNRLVLAAIACAVCALVVAGVIAWSSHQTKRAETAEKAQAAAERETAGAELRGRAVEDIGRAVDQLVEAERVIIREVHHERETIRLALGPDASVEGVVAGWAGGIDRLRGSAGPDRDPGEADDRDSGVRFYVLPPERETPPPPSWNA